VPQGTWRELLELIESNASETAIDTFLRECPEVLAGAAHFGRVNPHAAWVIPQAAIRPPLSTKQRGLRPDYLVGGYGSDGISWVVVEIKAPAQLVFAGGVGRGRIRLSSAANAGLCQLAQYLDFCSANQAYLRDFLGTRFFREPTGVLVISRMLEFEKDTSRQALKAALNRSLSASIQIRTFDALFAAGASFISTRA
jgi:hypothetical protein